MTLRVAPVRLSSPSYCRPRALRPRQDYLDVLDAAGSVEFGVGGALVGGQGVGDGDTVGDGGGGGAWGGLRCIGAMRPPVALQQTTVFSLLWKGYAITWRG